MALNVKHRRGSLPESRKPGEPEQTGPPGLTAGTWPGPSRFAVEERLVFAREGGKGLPPGFARVFPRTLPKGCNGRMLASCLRTSGPASLDPPLPKRKPEGPQKFSQLALAQVSRKKPAGLKMGPFMVDAIYTRH